MEDSNVTDVYRSPEIKVLLKASTDPRPHKMALSYAKAKIRALLRQKPLEKVALMDRPIDDLGYVAKDVIQSGGGVGGSLLGSYLAATAMPGSLRAKVLAGVAGAIGGSIVGGAIGRRVVDGAIAAADSVDMIPEALTHVDIMSDRQSRYSNMGSALGIASVVPLAARVMTNGTNPLLAIGGSLGTAYLASKVGNAAGNMIGYYRDRAVTPLQEQRP